MPRTVLNVFSTYDDRLATVETSTGVVMLRDPTDVQYHLDLFAFYQRYALRGGPARDFVLSVAGDHRRSG